MKRLLVGLFALFTVLVSAQTAHATFVVTIADSTGVIYAVITDQDVLTDANPSVDNLALISPVVAGDYTVNQLTASYSELGGIPTLNLNSIDIATGSAVPDTDLLITLSRTDITIPPGPQLLITGSGSGTWSQTGPGGDIYTYTGFADATNTATALSPLVLPGSTFVAGSCTQLSPSTVGNKSTNCDAPDALFTRNAGPYSLSNQIKLTLVNGSTIANLTAATSVFQAPEPASMVMFGLGLLGVGAVSRRRRLLGTK